MSTSPTPSPPQTLVIYEHRFYFPSSPTWTFRSLLTRPSRTRSRRVSSPVASPQSIHCSSDDGTHGVNGLSVMSSSTSSPYSLMTVAAHSICVGVYGLAVPYLSPTLNSFNLQFAAEASSLGCICVTIIFIWIGVRPTCIHVFIQFDKMLHSGSYIGIRSRSQTVIRSRTIVSDACYGFSAANCSAH